jgi:creatinine amidohydrolase
VSAAALATLRAALARTPALLQTLASAEAPFALDVSRVRSVQITGVGSSAAHARFLSALLSERLGLAARFVPLDAFPRAGDPRDVLVVFSQALSPNARLALAGPEAWQRVVLVTAAAASREPARREAVAALRRAGVQVLETAGADEFGGLLRVEGPLAAYRAAFTLGEAFGVAAPPELARVPDAMERALRLASERAAELAPRLATDELLLLASGSYREAADNLRLKWVEGLLRGVPPVSDPIELAHGPFQALFAKRASLLAFTRPDAEHERGRLARLRRMLDPDRHQLVSIEATLPGLLAIFEHEVQANALVLAALEHAGVDPGDWPGRGRDGPLYGLGPAPRPLAELTWPELEAALAAGRRVAVLPLGATEQHGPHLPFATDRWIADALAERFCARVPEAVRLPALALGASSEHLAFPGTLSLAEDTLGAVLADVARSLARHGFEAVFCFSAHGGNLGVLRAQQAALERAAAPCRWIGFADHGPLNASLHALAEAAGVPASAAGHHAGEIEASILAALRPAALRRDALAPGLLDVPPDADAVFYPDLRVHAPSGTVGDPRLASAERASLYLDAWVDALLEAYEDAKKRHQTKGTVHP